MKLAACGEKTTPARREITATALMWDGSCWIFGDGKQTSLGQVESLLEKVRHQPKHRDEAPESGANDVEIDQGKSGHAALCLASPGGALDTRFD